MTINNSILTDDDIRAATRGLSLYFLDIDQLERLVVQHDKTVFASRVIAEAARRMIEIKSRHVTNHFDTTSRVED